MALAYDYHHHHRCCARRCGKQESLVHTPQNSACTGGTWDRMVDYPTQADAAASVKVRSRPQMKHHPEFDLTCPCQQHVYIILGAREAAAQGLPKNQLQGRCTCGRSVQSKGHLIEKRGWVRTRATKVRRRTPEAHIHPMVASGGASRSIAFASELWGPTVLPL